MIKQLVVLGCIVVTGCAAHHPTKKDPKHTQLEECFGQIVVRDIEAGLIETVPGSDTPVVDPFTGKSFKCPDLQPTDKGVQKLMELRGSNNKK